MRNILLTLAAVLLVSLPAAAQPAKTVLDKVAAVVGNASGASAKFTIASQQYGNASGSIAIKGSKFHTNMETAEVWFDGKTQWTLMKRSNEVNINQPTEGELQAINPYTFINIYRSGYKLTMKQSGANYIVNMKATDAKRQIQEMEITVNKQSSIPSRIRMRQGSHWSTITISGFKRGGVTDAEFVFNAKKYPTAEIIDLR